MTTHHHCRFPSGASDIPCCGCRLAACRRAAFSLIEVLVAVTMLSLIVIGLLMMFNQTQSVFRGSMTQTDVLEPGRAATDLLARELEQIAPSYLNATHPNSTNFYAAVIDSGGPPYTTPTPYTPLLQSLPGSSFRRTNVLEDLFFVTCRNQIWTGIGYFVRDNSAVSGFSQGWSPVGTLYRFQTNNTAMQFQNPGSGQVGIRRSSSLFNSYRYATTNISKVLDGVVHFRIRAYDTNGNWINPANLNISSNIRTNFTGYSSGYTPYDANYFFRSNAVPASVELEIGILEPPVLERFRSLAANPAVARNYLANHVGGVHLFRQRVPVRTVDPEAYK